MHSGRTAPGSEAGGIRQQKCRTGGIVCLHSGKQAGWACIYPGGSGTGRCGDPDRKRSMEGR